MSEHIERKAHIAEIKDHYFNIPGGGHYLVEDALESVKTFPTANVEPVKHGQWIHTDFAAHWMGKDQCNQCGFHEKDRRDLSYYKYCPNCGAKMDLLEED